MSLSLLQYNILSLALLLPVALNLFMWEAPFLARIFGGVFFLFQCFVLGQHLAPNRPLYRQSLLGGLCTLVLLLITSTLVYLVWDLSKPAQVFAWFLFLLTTNLWFIRHGNVRQTRLELHELHWKHIAFPAKTWGLIACYTLLAASAFVVLLTAQTDIPLRSPWEAVPTVFWALIFVATLVLWVMVWQGQCRELSLPLVNTHLFLLFSVALIIYTYGYGYDSFIHQTAEHIIDSTGILLPKTPYYLGQYSLVVNLHRLVGLPIVLLDQLLVPVLAAISLPLIASELLKKSSDHQKPGLSYGAWLSLTVVMIPFSSFIVTTPQGLANLFFLWLVFGSFPLLVQQNAPWAIPHLAFVATAALLTHPLTGIPSFILLGAVCLELLRPRLQQRLLLRQALFAQFMLVAVFAIPFLLWLWSLSSNTQVQLRSSQYAESINRLGQELIVPILTGFMPGFPSQFSYFFVAGWVGIFLLVALFVSVWLLGRMKLSLLRVYLVSSLSFVANAVIIAGLFTFPGIAAYESHAYASRLLNLAIWTLMPFFILALLWVYRLPFLRHPAAAVLVVCALTWANTSALYASYPRQNRFERSRQFSTSTADFQAVQFIDSQTKSDYVVLANQSVSAAAIASYGFRTYFPPASGAAPVFYYPVPTSSPLYSIYLRMVNEQPTREVAELAHNLTGATTIYFVLNSYWDNAAQIKARALMEADASTDLANGAITVFTYRFSE